MIKRWVHAQIALDDQNNPVGIIYGGTSTFPNPQIKPPENVTQRVREPTAPLILDNKAHAEMVRKIYKDVQGY